MNKRTNNNFKTAEVVFLIIITCIISFMTCMFLYPKLVYKKNDSANIDNYVNEIISVYNEITSDYYGDIDQKKIIDGAIDGMLNALDDSYSTIIDESESDNFNIILEGSYEGLGIEIIETNIGIAIVNVFDGSPAAEAGLKPGDLILSIDNMVYSDMSASDFSHYVRSSKKESFNIKINRDGEENEFIVKRSNVTINSVTPKIINRNDKNIGYIYISTFASNTYNQFNKELSDLESKNIEALIIDLRDNTGGHLTSVSNILSLFLDSSHVIYQTETSKGVEKVYSNGDKTKEYPIYLLVNENSASASEILAGTLKDELDVTIVGKTTFGKGSVQELRTLSNGTQYKLTIKKWLTSGGKSIDGIGINPDYEIDLDNQYYDNPIDENDTQLNKVLELIK